VGAEFGDAVEVGEDDSIAAGVTFSLTFTGLAPGPGDFWIVPYTMTGTNGGPSALGSFTIT
jgi:hypothetical protein